jgi:LysM repeat protein
MTVRRRLLTALALGLALCGAGCGDRDRAPLPAETDDPYHVQGKQLQKQGRNAEALNAFLKVIDRRGENPAPESHLEVGLICLHHTKDPLAAIYHFRRYLKEHPNSKQAPYVLGQVEAARREFAVTLPGRPLEDQSARMAAEDELRKLRRENDELRAELAVLRGGGAVPVSRQPRMISLPPVMQSLSAPPPPPVTRVLAPPVMATAGSADAPDAAPPIIQRAPPTAAKPGRPATTGVPAKAAAGSGRAHTIAAKDTLYSIARRYNVKVEDLVAANPTVVPRVSSPLRVGTVLKIP